MFSSLNIEEFKRYNLLYLQLTGNKDGEGNRDKTTVHMLFILSYLNFVLMIYAPENVL